MNNSGDLLYSPEASATRYMYYQDLNDINIFVEDLGKEYEYETIFKRLLKNNYRIQSIFSCGGKSGVIEKFKEFGTFNSKKPHKKNFYIVDGDFDRYICPEKMINNKFFIYLETYNIESYYIDERACIQFSKGRLQCLDRDVEDKINFHWWKDTIVKQASKLFLVYCFIRKYYPENKSVSRSTGEFINANTGFERQDDAFNRYWTSILEIDSQADKKISEIKEKYLEINGDSYYNLICGKFLFDSLCWYIRGIIGSRFEHNDFKWYLTSHFDISKLNYVKNLIIELMST